MSRQVMTVLGPICPERLGITHTHEHLVIDLSVWFREPEEASARGRSGDPVDITMLGLLRRRPFSVTRDNMILADEALACEELRRFRRAGGNTICDTTNIGLHRDPVALQRISRETGVNIVMGGGCYVENAHPPWVAKRTADQLADLFIKEIRVGVADTGVRVGLLGEIGTSGIPRGETEPRGVFTVEEEKVLRAAARASAATGVALSVHLDARVKGSLRVIDLLEREGVPPDRIIMGHMDQMPDLDYHKATAARGVYVEYDSLGREHYADESGICWGHDTWRAQFITELIQAGHVRQLLLSQDVCLKMDLRRYGGYGFDHILTTIVPMLRRAGDGETEINTILVDNPARVLPFDVDAVVGMAAPGARSVLT